MPINNPKPSMTPNKVRQPKPQWGLDPDQFIGYIATHFGWFWQLIQKTPGLSNFVNKLLINTAIYKTQTRPYPFSTMASYTSWDSLTDRTFSSRHLGPKPQTAALPTSDTLFALFERKNGKTIECSKSTMLFAYFAQWFTDGFLRTDLTDFRKNTSNHEIDLSPVYGLNKAVTDVIREHAGGRLLSQIIHDEEYPPYLCDSQGVPKPQFQLLADNARQFGFFDADRTIDQKRQYFATGGDRANIQIGYLMLNVLFLREHNRIARLLARAYPGWDDERLFQTARNIVLVLLIRVVVEEYINHISPLEFQFFVDPHGFPNERWYRQNWMAVEFTLVYRWHMLIPDTVKLNNVDVSVLNTMWNSDLITSRGLGALFDDASKQPAGRIGLFNSPAFLKKVETDSIDMCRNLNLASYNDYLAQYGFPRVKKFEDISTDPAIVSEMRRLYNNDVDAVDYYVGILADDPAPNAALPNVIGSLVAIDAFSQALTNPLLNPNIYNEETFSPVGMQILNEPASLVDILMRNPTAAQGSFLATLTRTDWKRE